MFAQRFVFVIVSVALVFGCGLLSFADENPILQKLKEKRKESFEQQNSNRETGKKLKDKKANRPMNPREKAMSEIPGYKEEMERNRTATRDIRKDMMTKIMELARESQKNQQPVPQERVDIIVNETAERMADENIMHQKMIADLLEKNREAVVKASKEEIAAKVDKMKKIMEEKRLEKDGARKKRNEPGEEYPVAEDNGAIF